MKEKKVSVWVCSCGDEYDTAKECKDCEREHEFEMEYGKVGNTVWYDDGAIGPPTGMGLGNGTWEPKYVEGVIVAEKGEDRLVEYNKERHWVPLWCLVRNKRAAEYVRPEYDENATMTGVFYR
jgi:hypothetical protein